MTVDTLERIDPIDALQSNRNIFDIVMIAEGVYDATEEEQAQAWQYLHDSGLAYQMQGWFGRTAQQLIEAGVITA